MFTSMAVEVCLKAFPRPLTRIDVLATAETVRFVFLHYLKFLKRLSNFSSYVIVNLSFGLYADVHFGLY